MNARGSGIGARTSGISARVATELTALGAEICIVANFRKDCIG